MHKVLDPNRLKKYKKHLLLKLNKIKNEINKTKKLSSVFNEQWFMEVEDLINNYDGIKPFETNTHTIFIESLHDDIFHPRLSIVKEIDFYYGIIKTKIGPQRIKILKGKLRRLIQKDISNYLGTVYETIIVGKFVKAGFLKEYEAKVIGGRCEGIVEIEDEEIIIEATVFNPGIKMNRVGTMRPVVIKKLFNKIKNKIERFQKIQKPTILFINIDPANVLLPEKYEALEGVEHQTWFKHASALIISGYYRAENNKILVNTEALFPLRKKAIGITKKIFKAEKFFYWAELNK